MKEKTFSILCNIIITSTVYLLILVSWLFFGVSLTKRMLIELLDEFWGGKIGELNMLSESGIPILNSLEENNG